MNGSWNREFRIESISGVKRPLGLWKNGEVLFLGSSDHELVLFDRATGELKNLGIHDYPETMQLIPFVESSFPLKGQSELEVYIGSMLKTKRKRTKKGTIFMKWVLSLCNSCDIVH